MIANVRPNCKCKTVTTFLIFKPFTQLGVEKENYIASKCNIYKYLMTFRRMYKEQMLINFGNCLSSKELYDEFNNKRIHKITINVKHDCLDHHYFQTLQRKSNSNALYCNY